MARRRASPPGAAERLPWVRGAAQVRGHDQGGESMSDTQMPEDNRRFDRKKFIGISAAAAATPIVAGAVVRRAAAAPAAQLEEATIAQLQAQMTGGGLTAHSLVQMYLNRIDAIDRRGGLNSILELNTDADAIAKQLDAE